MFSLYSGIFYIILSILPIIYLYFIRNFNYWSKRGIVGPKPVPIFGNVFEYFKTPAHIVECNWLKQYGRVYGYYFGTTPIITVSDPHIIKSVLVKDFHLFPERRYHKWSHPALKNVLVDATGDDWKRIRTIVSPTFSSGKMKRMYPLIKECLNDFINHLNSYAKNRSHINAKEMYERLTMDIIATCAFATKTNAYKADENQFLFHAKKLTNFKIHRLIPVLILPKYLLNFLQYETFGGDMKSIDFVVDTSRQIMNKRRHSDKKFNDFIELVMEAQMEREIKRDRNDVNESHHVNEGEDTLEAERKALNGYEYNKQITEDEILAQAFIFILAGFESISTTLTFSSYELAMNPDIQERLYNEVMSAVDSKGEIDYEVLTTLPFLDSVVSETLRLHTQGFRTGRIASTDYKLGDTGFTVEKGIQIEFPVYAIHHCEEFYENPYKFDPDRFMPENRHKLTPYTYLPFGAGPRNCIAMRFSLLEVKSGLAQMLMKYKFLRTPETEYPLKQRRVFGMNSNKFIVLGIEERNQ